MPLTSLSLIAIAVSLVAYRYGCWLSIRQVGGPANSPALHSRPQYHGAYVAIYCLLPAFALVFAWVFAEQYVIAAMVLSTLPDAVQQLSPGELDLFVNNLRNIAVGNNAAGLVSAELQQGAELWRYFSAESRNLLVVASLLVATLFSGLASRRISPTFRARNHVEGVLVGILVAASSIALLTTAGILLSVLFEALRFFREVPVSDFIFGLEWSPQTAIRDDQAGSSGSFGAVPLFAGTLLITLIAMCVAVPIGLLTAVYLNEYSSDRLRAIAKPLLEILAGIPTVVYGFFAAVTVAPLVRSVGEALGLQVAAGSALAAGLVMGIMIIPLVSSMSDDAIRSVPRELRDGSQALGATQSETLLRVVMPAALPGIAGGVLLAVSRAIGETMIVVMAAGLAANLTANPLQAVTTLTVQITTLLVGDQEFNSAKTLAAFALGLFLFLTTLVLNVLGLRIVRRYRERYA